MEDSKLVIKQIDGTLAARLIVSGANSLSGDRGKIDALNVFPVPDGDTGTNMSKFWSYTFSAYTWNFKIYRLKKLY